MLLDMDEGIKEIRELIHNNADQQAHEQALFTIARQERLLEDLRDILTNHHLATAVRVHKALECIDDKIPFY
jgi:hypothetical protein